MYSSKSTIVFMGLLVLAGIHGRLQAGPAPADPGTAPTGSDASLLAAGERLYRKGIGVNGTPVTVTVQGDLDVPGTTMACINCHRRSGWGTTEGRLTTPPVVGQVLFAPLVAGNERVGIRSTGPGTRPAYDEAALARLLRRGVDAAGRTLSATMPRYDLSAADVAALSAYLRTLGAAAPPGVTDTTLHLATITTPTADAAKRDAVLAVLRAFAETKNGGTRHETRRRTNGPWDMKAHYELYREWALHEWSLHGPSSTWPQQLADYYAAQPVFAIVSGIADGDWTPVHEFCERNGVPCIFPLADAPPDRGVDGGFYSLYFSQGAALEAAALAHALSGSDVPAGAVLQVSRCGAPGEVAAARLASAIDKERRVVTRCVEPGVRLDAGSWRALLDEVPAPILVPWLDAADLAGLQAFAAAAGVGAGVGRVYLSATLVGDRPDALGGAWRDRVFLVDPYVPPDELEQHASRSLAWLKTRGAAGPDRIAAVNAFFAIGVVSDALATPRVIGSKEYFVEVLEHMVSRTAQRSAYPSVTLAPLRHFGSFGCAILKPAESGRFTAMVPWFVPETWTGR